MLMQYYVLILIAMCIYTTTYALTRVDLRITMSLYQSIDYVLLSVRNVVESISHVRIEVGASVAIVIGNLLIVTEL